MTFLDFRFALRLISTLSENLAQKNLVTRPFNFVSHPFSCQGLRQFQCQCTGQKPISYVKWHLVYDATLYGI